MAKRHECVNKISHQCDGGDGAPKRKRCSFCGGDFLVTDGEWGVFEWHSDGRYRAADAHATFASRRAAQRRADFAHDTVGGNLVVRWVAA